jgi:16S rRNA processing protein RimM
VPERRILLGVIGRAHGVRGLVRVTSHTADPAALTAYGPLTDAKGRRFALRWRGEGVAEVSEIVGGTAVKVTDRSVAERLTNTPLYIDRDQLPPVEDDEFYLADLIGLAAFDPHGAALGRVTVVHDYGAGTSIEIERDAAPALIVPFTHACVPVVDVAGERVVVVVPVDQDNVNDSPSPRGRGLGGGGGAAGGTAVEATTETPPPPNPLPRGEGENSHSYLAHRAAP